MPFADLDTAGISRVLAQIAEEPGDLADVFFERREDIELPPEDREPGLAVWRESGLAVRLGRGGRCWLCGRDRIDQQAFQHAVRRVARVMPHTLYPQPGLAPPPWNEPPRADELLEFPASLSRAIRAHQVSFPVALSVWRHRRWVRVIGTQLASATEAETFYSIRADLPWGRHGCLLPDLGEGRVEEVARSLVRAFRARDAATPAPFRGVCVLGSAAAAVLLHEAVAHALEADILALGGHPEAAVGVALGSPVLNVFDDPQSAPKSVRRASDDEGFPVLRRCLLRAGVVEQPLADTAWSRKSDVLAAGAGRRGNRHLPPGPRSSHLELVPGELAQQELMADAEGGLFLPEAQRGHLDPMTGEFTLRFPYGRRIHNRVPGPPVGGCSIRGQVGDLLGKVVAVGRELRAAGAGWCAKGGVKLPVWATTPELRLEDVEILP